MSAGKRQKLYAPRLTKARLTEMVEEATLDAYGESEQRTAFYTLLDQHLETPFETKILDVTVTVERIEMTDDEQIIAICRRGPLTTGDCDSRPSAAEAAPCGRGMD